jgi:hypothetical protein
MTSFAQLLLVVPAKSCASLLPFDIERLLSRMPDQSYQSTDCEHDAPICGPLSSRDVAS